MMADIEEEKSALKKELKWLLRDEVHTVLADINHTLQECSKCFPMKIQGPADDNLRKGADGDTQTHGQIYNSHRLIMNATTPASSASPNKCMITLKGDSVTEADILFKHKDKSSKDNQNYKTSILPEKEWKIQQIQDAANHLQEALAIVGSRQHSYKFKSPQEVFYLLEKLKQRVQDCRSCLQFPKRKALNDLLNSKHREIFNPPLPQNIALSIYIHGSKVVMAIYYLHVNGLQKLDVSQRVQLEATVQWLNDIFLFFTLALQQCQQLYDKVNAVVECGGWKRTDPV